MNLYLNCNISLVIIEDPLNMQYFKFIEKISLLQIFFQVNCLYTLKKSTSIENYCSLSNTNYQKRINEIPYDRPCY